VVDIQLAEYLLHLRIKVPGAELVHTDDGIAEGVRIFELRSELKFLDGRDHGMLVMKDVFQHRKVFLEFWFLFEEGNRDFLIDPYRAAVDGFFTGKDFEQRAFAGAVLGDQRNLIAFGDVEGNVAEKRLDAV
jgi:hypothetical protein